MINGLLFSFTIFAVLWLARWSMRAEAGRQDRWAPFDMREPRQGAVQNPEPPVSPRRRQARSVRTRRSP